MIPQGLFVEWSRYAIHSLVFEHPDSLPEFGFRTVYAFDKEAVKALKDQGNASGMNRFIAWSDHLFIDIDNDQDSVTAYQQLFQSRNTNYSMWESGGKGVHFHVPTATYSHKQLPRIHSLLVSTFGIPCDRSLYRHNSLFRLPGTRHAKTGKQKRLIGQLTDGQDLTIPEKIIRQVDETQVIVTPLKREYGQAEEALLQGIHLMLNEPQVGRRYQSMWSLAANLAQSGFSESFAEELLLVVNEKWENAKEGEEIERALREAYRSSSARLD